LEANQFSGSEFFRDSAAPPAIVMAAGYFRYTRKERLFYRDIPRFREKFDPDPAWRATSTGAPFDAATAFAGRR